MFTLTSLQKRPLFLYVVLFILTILSRLSAINRYITPDELIWVYRSVTFTEALKDGRWIDTITTGHPGVTITWIGSLAIYLQKLIQPTSQASYQWITHIAWLTPTNMVGLQELSVFLTAGRLGIIVLNSLGLLLIFKLTWRLFGFEVGLLTAVFLAVDPFVAGLSGLMHIDATMTLFSVIALLSLAMALKEAENLQTSLRYTAVSAICSSLALLTKSPAILLIPLLLMVLIIKGFVDQTMALPTKRRWLGWSLFLWCFCFVLTSYITLPALWSSFSFVLDAIRGDANQHIGNALRPTFFLGGTDFDHGPIFYPISLIFRLAPLPFLGLFLSIGLMLKWGQQRYESFHWSTLIVDLQSPIFLFLLWTAGFIGGITLAAKKFDRYALPVIPILILLSSLGWIWFLNKRKRPFLWFSFLILGSLGNALYFQPNPLSAYNFVLGGPWVVQRVMAVGWGEPISIATRWLEVNEVTINSTTIGSIPQAIAPFYSGTPLLASDEFYPQANYIIWTQNDRQLTGLAQPPLLEESALIHTIRYGGLTQAWIYKQSEPIMDSFTPIQLENRVDFNGRIGVTATALQANPQQIDLLLSWQLRNKTENGRFAVRLTAVDENGLIWYQSEQPLVNETTFYPEYWPTENATIRYGIPFPDGSPPVEYTVKIALVELQTGNLQPLYSLENGFEGTAFSIGEIAPLPNPKTNASVLPIDVPLNISWPSANLTLLGYSYLPSPLTTGEPIALRLFWRGLGDSRENAQLQFKVGDNTTTVPLSRYNPVHWQEGEIIQEQYPLVVPTDFIDPQLSVEVTLLDKHGEILGESVLLGEIEITPLDRLFELPASIEVPLDYRFGEGVYLRGVNVEDTAVSPDNFTLTLYWEIVKPPSFLISAFVHLVQSDGSNYAQSDQWPGGLPADLWAEGQIIVDKHTIDLPEGQYPETVELAVGLYTAENGVRLSAFDSQNNPIPDNRLFLPIPVKISD